MTTIYKPPPSLESVAIKLIELLAYTEHAKITVTFECSNGDRSVSVFDRLPQKPFHLAKENQSE